MADTEAVFAKNVLTVTNTAVPEAGADSHVYIGGSAGDWGAITSAAFLRGPEPGQEQVLVSSGDQSIAIRRNRTTVIGENEILEVFKQLGLKTGVEHYIEGPGGSTRIDAGGVTILGRLVKVNSR